MTDALDCPRCQAPMKLWSDFRGTIGGCPSCGGVWAEVKSMKAVTLRPEATDHQAEVSPERSPDLDEPAQCPRCRRVMERRVMGSGGRAVTLDGCAEHGHWFDHGELSKVAAELRREAQKAANEQTPEEHNYAVTADNLHAVQFRADVESYKKDPIAMIMSDSWAAEVAWFESVGGLLERLFFFWRR